MNRLIKTPPLDSMKDYKLELFAGKNIKLTKNKKSRNLAL